MPTRNEARKAFRKFLAKHGSEAGQKIADRFGVIGRIPVANLPEFIAACEGEPGTITAREAPKTVAEFAKAFWAKVKASRNV